MHEEGEKSIIMLNSLVLKLSSNKIMMLRFSINLHKIIQLISHLSSLARSRHIYSTRTQFHADNSIPYLYSIEND